MNNSVNVIIDIDPGRSLMGSSGPVIITMKPGKELETVKKKGYKTFHDMSMTGCCE